MENTEQQNARGILLSLPLKDAGRIIRALPSAEFTVAVSGECTYDAMQTLADGVRESTARLHLDLRQVTGLEFLTSAFSTLQYAGGGRLKETGGYHSERIGKYNTSLVSVQLPEGVKGICNGCFLGCETLQEVSLPESLLFIGDAAFYDCSLRQVTIPSSVVVIGEYAFCRDRNGEEIFFPKSVKRIGTGNIGYGVMKFEISEADRWEKENKYEYDAFSSFSNRDIQVQWGCPAHSVLPLPAAPLGRHHTGYCQCGGVLIPYSIQFGRVASM